jgi:GDP-L-fucose synthase
MKNKILITGSNGLLGSAFRTILGDKNHVYHTRKDCDLTLEKETIDYITKIVNEQNIDTIVHCAAKVGGVKANSENNEGFFIENYKINNNVIKAAFHNKIPNFVNILSTCIFPDNNINYPLTPKQIDYGAPHNSNYGYSYAKRLSGYETKIFRNITGLNWFSVVPTNIYGPYDNFNIENSHLIPGLIHRAFLAKKYNQKFVVWGDGKALRQFIYAEDLVKLILWSLDNWKVEEHCMLVNEEEVSILEIVDIIKNKIGIQNEDIIFDETKPKGQHRKPAISDMKIYDFVPLKKGIEETIDWFIKNYDTIRK